MTNISDDISKPLEGRNPANTGITGNGVVLSKYLPGGIHYQPGIEQDQLAEYKPAYVAEWLERRIEELSEMATNEERRERIARITNPGLKVALNRRLNEMNREKKAAGAR